MAGFEYEGRFNLFGLCLASLCLVCLPIDLIIIQNSTICIGKVVYRKFDQGMCLLTICTWLVPGLTCSLMLVGPVVFWKMQAVRPIGSLRWGKEAVEWWLELKTASIRPSVI